MKYKTQKENQFGKNNPAWKGGKPHCIDCGKQIWYGSKRCYSCNAKYRFEKNPELKNIIKNNLPKEMKGKNNPNYKDGRTLNKKCVICGKELPDYRYIVCSKKCRSIYVKQQETYKLENNPNWRGGKSFEPYPLGWNKTFKEQIRYRDSYKCQLCGCHEVECSRKLHVHHIDYKKENIQEDNLISLCPSCHMKTNFNREYWKKYFKKERINYEKR